MPKLREEHLMCAEVMRRSGHSLRAAAQDLGVAESTLRYRLQRRTQGGVDGRSRQGEACAPLDEVIQAWIDAQAHLSGRPDSVRSLYERLMVEEGFVGSYKSVLRFVRRRQSPLRLRPHRRVETRPGSQAQLDWAQVELYVEALGGWSKLNAFLMTLSYSRMWSVQWSVDQGLLAWLTCHNRAFQVLGGVPWTVRIDNLKTGVAQGGGPWAVLNPAYASYAGQMGFVVDPCRPGQAPDKGKVERRVRDVKGELIPPDERFDCLESLQQETDARISHRAKRLFCPVTGLSIAQSWQQERSFLSPLPLTLPIPFDVQVSRQVGRDGLVHFENRQYAVPFGYVGRTVEVRGCPGKVEIHGDGHLLIAYPRHTQSRLLIDQSCYEGPDTPHVARPEPLGQIGQAIVLPKSWEAPRRPLEAYAGLVEQAGRRRP